LIYRLLYIAPQLLPALMWISLIWLPAYTGFIIFYMITKTATFQFPWRTGADDSGVVTLMTR